MDLISILSITLGLFSFLGGALLWYKGSVEKRYAAQRDFNHLKNNYQQMSEALAAIAKDMDTRFDSTDDQLKEIKLTIQYRLGGDKTLY